jgi:biopolymer transport protein TolR
VTGKGTRRHRTSLVHAKPKKLDDVRSDINVTPLVDVCLVLLIIFMVVLDKLARGKDVPLPKTLHHTEKRDNGDDLIVSISRDGSRAQIWWDRDQLADLPAFKQRLEDELRRKPRPMYVKADADLTYGSVYPVLMAIHDAGANMVQLATQEQKEAQ